MWRFRLGEVCAGPQDGAVVCTQMHALCLHRTDAVLRGLTGLWHYKQWFLDWWGGRQVPQLFQLCGFTSWWEWLPSCGGPECVPGSSSVAGLAGECSPMQWATLQHPHHPHSSKGSPEWTVTSHKKLYRLVCQSISRGPLYLFASSAVMKRPSTERVSRLPAAGISSSSHQDFN